MWNLEISRWWDLNYRYTKSPSSWFSSSSSPFARGVPMRWDDAKIFAVKQLRLESSIPITKVNWTWQKSIRLTISKTQIHERKLECFHTRQLSKDCRITSRTKVHVRRTTGRIQRIEVLWMKWKLWVIIDSIDCVLTRDLRSIHQDTRFTINSCLDTATAYTLYNIPSGYPMETSFCFTKSKPCEEVHIKVESSWIIYEIYAAVIGEYRVNLLIVHIEVIYIQLKCSPYRSRRIWYSPYEENGWRRFWKN